MDKAISMICTVRQTFKKLAMVASWFLEKGFGFVNFVLVFWF